MVCSIRINLFIRGLACSILIVASSNLPGSGFQTSFHSVSSFSRGLAGAGVSGDDLADFYYNPAAVSLYSPGNFQAYFGAGTFKNQFVDKGSTRTVGPVAFPSDGAVEGIDEPVYGGSFQWISGQQSKYRFGVFVGNAFGNQNEYSTNWIGRYHALETSLRVWDISPTISFPIGDKTSLGFNLSIQKSVAKLSQAQIVPLPGGGFLPDGKTTMEGDDIAFGFGIGLIHEFKNVVLGASYRSSVKHSLEGDLKVTGTPGGDAVLPAKADLELPETVYLSAKFGFANHDKWNLYWTSRWTRWSRNKELRVSSVDGSFPDSVTPQNWNDTWLHGAGLSFQYSEKLKLRFGLTVDQTPIPSAELKTPRQPEGDRTWISFGFSRVLKNGGVIDVGFNHQIIDDGDINNTKTDLVSSVPGLVTDTLKGTYSDATVNFLGIQYRKDY